MNLDLASQSLAFTQSLALTVKTMLSSQTIERLLTQSCQRSYAVSFDGTEETARGQRKIIRIVFTHPSDRERFRALLRRLAKIAPARPDLRHVIGSS